MFGKFLSTALKVATLPIDIVESGVDACTGGDGSKSSRQGTIIGAASSVRDEIADAVEEAIDE